MKIFKFSNKFLNKNFRRFYSKCYCSVNDNNPCITTAIILLLGLQEDIRYPKQEDKIFSLSMYLSLPVSCSQAIL